jgi:hypothetical protein
MLAASILRVCSWRFGASWFAETKHRREWRRWLPVASDEARSERVRHQIVADVSGPPAGVLDFGHREGAEAQSLNRVDWHGLPLTPIS